MGNVKKMINARGNEDVPMVSAKETVAVQMKIKNACSMSNLIHWVLGDANLIMSAEEKEPVLIIINALEKVVVNMKR